MNNRVFIAAALTLVLGVGGAGAIPQDFFGGGGIGPFPNFNQDLTEEFINADNWKNGALSGDWKKVPALEGEDVQRMQSNPKLFGHHPVAVYATRLDGKLSAISILYADAGSFFGYKPGGTFDRDSEEAAAERALLKTKQQDFKKRMRELDKGVARELARVTGDRGERKRLGKTPMLQTNFVDYVHGEHTLRFSVQEEHAISLTITPTEHLPTAYLDATLEDLSLRDRRGLLEEQVKTAPDGDVSIDSVPVFEQGLRPYCAVSTLGMVTHYMGLRLGVSGLAAGAKFKNTGSAKGAKILELYRASAVESETKLSRGGAAKFSRIKSSIDRGMPIVVWRKYSRERNRIHSAASGKGKGDTKVSLPEPDAADQASWPGDGAPGHASVITGYNEELQEVIFMESWGEHTRNRRMRGEEMEATSYMSFYFRL